MFQYLKAFREDFLQHMAWMEMECQFDKLPPPNIFTELLWFCFSTLQWRFREIQCHFIGHKWHVESVITPDTGREDFECTRCGHNHRITYF